MYIGPERHRPGHKSGQAGSVTAWGKLSPPGSFPKIYLGPDKARALAENWRALRG